MDTPVYQANTDLGDLNSVIEVTSMLLSLKVKYFLVLAL